MLSIIDILFKGHIESQYEYDFVLAFLKEEVIKLSDSNTLIHQLNNDDLEDLLKRTIFKKEIITTLTNILKESNKK
jgi:hypothetical protein